MPGDGPIPRVLVVGLGGIGGIVAASLEELARQGAVRVTALTTNEAVARSVNERGYLLRGMEGARTVPGRAHTDLPGDGPYDFVLLAVPPTSVEASARQAAPHLAEGGSVVCLQNGLCEERVAPLVGDDRVIGAIVSWGASMPEPGVFERTAAGGFTLGRLRRPAATAPQHLGSLASLLEPVGPVATTDNLAGARWSKLAINCAISTLGTIGGARLGELLQLRDVRRLALEIMSEAVTVARASGISLEKVAGTVDLSWLALTPAERAARGAASLVAKHALLLAVGARYRNMRSSMLAAIERGRPPSVDYLNGEIVERGASLGVPSPANQGARELVHAIARGLHRPGVDTVQSLARQVLGPR